MKKGFKKTLATLAAGAMLLSMNMSAFALLDNYSAITTYTSGTTATVNVSGVTTGIKDQVAVLAENGSKVIYVDQKVADDEGVVADFSFAIDLEDANGNPTIKIGSTSEATREAKSIKLLSGVEVTVTAGDDLGYIYELDETTITESSFQVYVVPSSGYEVVSYTVNNNEPVAASVNSENAVTVNLTGVTGTADVVINFAEADADPVINVTSIAPVAEGRGFTVIGTASGAKDFGVLMAETEATIDNVSDVANYSAFSKDVRKFAAMATGYQGSFSITVEEDAEAGEYKHLTKTSYFVAPYAEGADPEVQAATAVTFNN